MEEVLLIGGGGHCKSVIDVIEQEGKFKIAGIIDQPELLNTKVLDYKVIGNDDDLSKLILKYKYALVTVGQIISPQLRIKIYENLKQQGFILPIITSPRAYVSKHAKVKEGTIIMHDALINANVYIGENCIINTKALIEHDAMIGKHCHISTGAIINGAVNVESGCFVGSHATTKQGINIKENSFIKAGSVVK